ncbi:hypothetical protein OCF84_21075 (plasmid) [Shewanella xiamenensis]|uniref:Uncharacterized protein n=2 Tax=Shewanella xiamenensis TaxID=332186 RepID=A0ABT6UFW3_9GAMM|nr:hypothetical protein [Shewanella xiamenensis]MDI5832630.1 hypothetical protein [Shewanella xiamenensis]WHF58013.1 hypothetical protein OCF84_21075 [Shewanella xiamenensis]
MTHVNKPLIRDFVFNAAMAMIKFNESQFGYNSPVCAAQRTKVFSKMVSMHVSGDNSNTLNVTNDEGQCLNFCSTGIGDSVLHPELGIVSLSEAISQTNQIDNPTVYDQKTLSSLTDELCSNLNTYNLNLPQYASARSDLGSKAVKTCEMLTRQFKLWSNQSRLDYINLICESANESVKAILGNWKEEVHCKNLSITLDEKSNGEIILTSFKSKGKSILSHTFYPIEAMCQWNDITSQTSSPLQPLDYKSSKIDPNDSSIYLTNEDINSTIDRFMQLEVTKNAFTKYIERMFNVGLAPTLTTASQFGAPNNYPYYLLLSNVPGHDAKLGVQYLLADADDCGSVDKNFLELLSKAIRKLKSDEISLNSEEVAEALIEQGVDLIALTDIESYNKIPYWQGQISSVEKSGLIEAYGSRCVQIKLNSLIDEIDSELTLKDEFTHTDPQIEQALSL